MATEQAVVVTARPGRLATWLPLRWLWPLLVIAAAFIGPASNPIGLPDIWWTLQSGAWMIEHRGIHHRQEHAQCDPFPAD